VPASAADYPDHAVKVIVPFAAGGPTDVMARLIAQKLSERLGRQFFVENRAGAAGVIGSKFVIGAKPDCDTLLYTPSSLSLVVAIDKVAPYDVTKDFTPIINVAISPYALVVNPSVPAQNLQELIAYAKANPGKLSFSSAGVGSASHLAGELFKSEAGIEMVHVPNKGMSPALLDVISGNVQLMFASVPGMMSERTRVRPIAMAEIKRSALLPDLPTMDEQGLKGFAVANWAGLLGPAKLDPAVVR
jgi:tripartite-type tricarboxylate transporter receptor subunit TctC